MTQLALSNGPWIRVRLLLPAQHRTVPSHLSVLRAALPGRHRTANPRFPRARRGAALTGEGVSALISGKIHQCRRIWEHARCSQVRLWHCEFCECEPGGSELGWPLPEPLRQNGECLSFFFSFCIPAPAGNRRCHAAINAKVSYCVSLNYFFFCCTVVLPWSKVVFFKILQVALFYSSSWYFAFVTRR